MTLSPFTEHEGRIPYDSIRKWREPDKVIISAQVAVDKNGLFDLNRFLDGTDGEMITEEEAILPARMAHAVVALRGCTVQEIEVLKVWIKPAFVPILERVLLQPS